MTQLRDLSGIGRSIRTDFSGIGEIADQLRASRRSGELSRSSQLRDQLTELRIGEAEIKSQPISDTKKASGLTKELLEIAKVNPDTANRIAKTRIPQSGLDKFFPSEGNLFEKQGDDVITRVIDVSGNLVRVTTTPDGQQTSVIEETTEQRERKLKLEEDKAKRISTAKREPKRNVRTFEKGGQVFEQEIKQSDTGSFEDVGEPVPITSAFKEQQKRKISTAEKLQAVKTKGTIRLKERQQDIDIENAVLDAGIEEVSQDQKLENKKSFEAIQQVNRITNIGLKNNKTNTKGLANEKREKSVSSLVDKIVKEETVRLQGTEEQLPQFYKLLLLNEIDIDPGKNNKSDTEILSSAMSNLEKRLRETVTVTETGFFGGRSTKQVLKSGEQLLEILNEQQKFDFDGKEVKDRKLVKQQFSPSTGQTFNVFSDGTRELAK